VTGRKRCGLLTSRQPAPAIFLWCRSLETGRSAAGTTCLILRYIRSEMLNAAPTRRPGAPAFGSDSVLDRGPEVDPPAGGSVQPGVHRPAAGGPLVTWWDPGVLKLDVEEQAPLRQQRILDVDKDNATAAASDRGYAGWKTARDEILASASRPTLSVQTVTTLTPEEANDRVHVEIVTVPGRPERPRGRRFGVLVHAVLAAVDLRSSPEGVRAAAAMHGRLVNATHEEIEAAATAVQTALLHPLMRRAARAADSDGLRRETPILLQRGAKRPFRIGHRSRSMATRRGGGRGSASQETTVTTQNSLLPPRGRDPRTRDVSSTRSVRRSRGTFGPFASGIRPDERRP
jgi:hypothetical protein